MPAPLPLAVTTISALGTGLSAAVAVSIVSRSATASAPSRTDPTTLVRLSPNCGVTTRWPDGAVTARMPIRAVTTLLMLMSMWSVAGSAVVPNTCASMASQALRLSCAPMTSTNHSRNRATP